MRAPNSRRLLLAVDAIFGVVLIIAAFAGAVPRLLVGSSPAQTQAVAPELVQRFGGLAPPGQTTGLAVASDGSLGVVDRGRNVVLHLDAAGRPLAEWGPRFGAGLDAQDLLGLAASADGWWVLDRGAQRILLLSSSGEVQPGRTIDLQPVATYGPTGLAVDASNNVYVADTGRDRILMFDARGRSVRTIGDSGADLGKLKQPMGLAFAADGSMFVADWENGRVEHFDASGDALGAWPLPVHAWGLAVDSLGRIYVPDGDRKLIRAFGPDGALVFQLGGEAPGGPIPVEFPSQVAVSPDGSTLWVLGLDALARVDLRPFNAFRPTPASEPIRWPLAALGAVLLAVAAAATFSPRLRAGRGVRVPRPAPLPPSAAAPTAVRTNWRTMRLPAVPAREARLIGVPLVILGLAAASVAAVRLQDPLIVADPWPSMALLAIASLMFASGCTLTAQASPLVWVTDWPLCATPAARSTEPQEVRPTSRVSPQVAVGRTSLDRLRLATRQSAQRQVPWFSAAFPGGSVMPRQVLLLAALGTALPAGAAAVIWWLQRFLTPEATRGAILWLLAIGVLATTVAFTANWRWSKPSPQTAVPWILFALALAPRLWDNANLPYGVWFDEAQAGLEARKFLAEGRYTPITDTFGRDASLFYYLISAASILIKDPITAGRATAAIVGALNAPFLYLLGRELFGQRVGLAAGVLLAASRWHLDVSRLGWDPISLPATATLAFWLLARAVRTERWSDLAWAGMAFGLGMHGYIGFRALPAVALILLVYAAWRRRWSLQRATTAVALATAAAILVALPVVIFAIQDPHAFNGRIDQTLIFAQPGTQAQKLDDLWSNVQKHALMFHVRGDMNGRHNLPGWPMLDPASGVLAMLGFAWLLIRLLDWRAWLVFGWGIVAMSGGILTLPFEAPQAMRTLAVTPLLALLSGLSIVLLADRLSLLRRPVAARAITRTAAALAAVALAWIAILNVTSFFTRQMTDPTVWESFSTRETLPARSANSRYEAILGSPTMAPSVESQLLVPNLQDRIRAFDATSDLPYRGPGPALIVLETEHDSALAGEVARYYPNALHTQIVAPNAVRPLAEQFILEPDVLAARRGIQATYRAADGTSLERRETSPEFDPATLGLQGPIRVRWRTGLALDAPGRYMFPASDGFALTVDGAPVTRAGLNLPRGNHVLELDGTLTVGQTLSLSWQPPTATTPESIDPRVLYLPPDGGSGLTATFFPTPAWTGAAREDVIDPVVGHYFHTNQFARQNLDPGGNWSAEWRGLLQAPASGTYRFEADRLSRAGLWIDERPVFDDTAPDSAPQISGVAELTAGAHQIRVRFQDRSDGGPHIYLFWTPPGGARQVIPGAVLYPLPPTAQ